MGIVRCSIFGALFMLQNNSHLDQFFGGFLEFHIFMEGKYLKHLNNSSPAAACACLYMCMRTVAGKNVLIEMWLVCIRGSACV